MSSAGHTERAMLYHELEDGMYSVTSYFFAKVEKKKKTHTQTHTEPLQQGSASLHAGVTVLYSAVMWHSGDYREIMMHCASTSINTEL